VIKFSLNIYFNNSLEVLLLIMLRLFVERVDHCVKVFDGLQTVVKHICWFVLLKDYQTIAALVESSSNFLVKNHL
jgi:hypothetical protein